MKEKLNHVYTWSLYAPDTNYQRLIGFWRKKREKEKKKRNDTLSNKQYRHMGGFFFQIDLHCVN